MKSARGETVFDDYFYSVYAERWTQIKEALREDDKKIARTNLYFTSLNEVKSSVPGLLEPYEGLKNCFHISEDFDLSGLDEALLPFYRMDPASLFPAYALQVAPGQSVLDMCAAPGGKSLVLIESLTGVAEGKNDLSGEFVANEMSPKRRHRMMSVFKRHLPKDVRSMVKIRGGDGSRIGLERKEQFDRVLLDAPCSGERGLLHKKSELALWKEKRTKSFGIRQYALLASAFMTTKPGGRIVYSTCSISPYENDEVIRKLSKRHSGGFEIEFDQKEFGEKTEFGTQFLPDKGGWGPIYYSVITKK